MLILTRLLPCAIRQEREEGTHAAHDATDDFVNLRWRDLARSIAFYKAVGATQDMRFSDETAACMAFSETIHVMLLTHAKYAQFTSKPIVDARQGSEVLLASPAPAATRWRRPGRAVAGGGRPDPTPEQDMGFMYGRSYEDPDGHIWEVMWMDVEAAMQSGLGQRCGLRRL